MTDALCIALAQLNPTVGDLDGNEARVLASIHEAQAAGADLVVFSELVLCGYPPEDLVLKEHFLRDCRAAVDRVAAACTGIVAIVGFPERADDVYNAAAICGGGRVLGTYRKQHLPNYGVFDELRYFQSGTEACVVSVADIDVGVTICEDIWQPGPPLTDAAEAGAAVIVNLSASPYHAGKGAERERMLAQRARDSVACVAFCGQVGGQDELVFDGHSLIVDHEGTTLARAPQFVESLLVCTLDVGAARAQRLRDTRARQASRDEPRPVVRLRAPRSRAGYRPASAVTPPPIADVLPDIEEMYRALVCGTSDYVQKNGFARVVLGLSGGIDSALVALIAVDALGPDRVTCVTMPSPYSSAGTRGDAHVLAERLKVALLELPIAEVMASYDTALAGPFADCEADLTEENLQARIRGNLLMALSNKFGWLVLTTGNKSELSVGYSTLYGDSAGGFAVIKDVRKTIVYRLVADRQRRADRELVPATILTRPPSAELRPDQRDEDSLPPYDLLDQIIEGYVEDDLGREALVAAGMPANEVDRILRLIDLAEYKRRQHPPGIKLTPKAFGRDRRMPITNRYRG